MHLHLNEYTLQYYLSLTCHNYKYIFVYLFTSISVLYYSSLIDFTLVDWLLLPVFN